MAGPAAVPWRNSTPNTSWWSPPPWPATVLPPRRPCAGRDPRRAAVPVAARSGLRHCIPGRHRPWRTRRCYQFIGWLWLRSLSVRACTKFLGASGGENSFLGFSRLGGRDRRRHAERPDAGVNAVGGYSGSHRPDRATCRGDRPTVPAARGMASQGHRADQPRAGRVPAAKLETGRSGGQPAFQAGPGRVGVRQDITARLARPSGAPRSLYIRVADSPFDDNHRLLAYLAPDYRRSGGRSPDGSDRRSTWTWSPRAGPARW